MRDSRIIHFLLLQITTEKITGTKENLKMINVYYGPSISCPFLLTGQPIQPLLKNLKASQDYLEMLNCPSFVKFCADFFVLQSPFNLEIKIHADGYPVASLNKGQFVSEPTNKANGEGLVSNLLQMFSQGLWLFFAENNCSINMYPPFLHDSKMYGVAGSFDIGTWFRPLSIASIVKEPFSIKEGDPLAYVKFDQDVNLKRVVWDNEAEIIYSQMNNFKTLQRRSSLASLYGRSKLSGLNKKILKIAERCVIDED